MEAQALYQTAIALLPDRNQLMAVNSAPGENDEELAQLDAAEMDLLIEVFQKSVKKAQKDKFIALKKAAYNAAIERKLSPPPTINDFKKEIMERGKKLAEEELWPSPFVVDESNQAIYNALCLYFMGFDCELDGALITPKKGLLVFGNIGCGKTAALRLFQRNPLQSYQFVSCRNVEAMYDAKGAEAIAYFGGTVQVQSPTQFYGQNYKGFAFDDLGTEMDARHFGKTMNIMETILLNRYDDSSLARPMTHVTTNLDANEIKERYGRRVFDRCRQMFNLISFPENASSRRQ